MSDFTPQEIATLTTLLDRKDWHNDQEVRLLARILLGRVFTEHDSEPPIDTP